MAKPREVRGWLVYAAAVGAAFLMLAFRLFYGTGSTVSPFLLFSWVDLPFLFGVLAGVLAAVGLHQALWFSLVKPGGWTLYGASLLAFVLACLLFYALPLHVGTTSLFLLMFVAALVLLAYVPALSFGSRALLGIAIAGDAALAASSLYGPLKGFAPFTEPLVASTLAVEALLLLTLLRLFRLAFQGARTAAAAPA